MQADKKQKSTRGIKKPEKAKKARPAREIHPPQRLKNTKLSPEQIQRYKLPEEWCKNQDYYFLHQDEIDQKYDGKWIEVSNEQILGAYDSVDEFSMIIKTKNSFVIQAGMNYPEKRR